MPPKVSLLKLTQSEATTKLYNECHVLQDLLVPIKDFETSIIRLDETLKIYPVWLCAFNLLPNPGLVHPKENTAPEMYIDIGLYGTPQVDDYIPQETTRKIEEYVRDVHGSVESCLCTRFLLINFLLFQFSNVICRYVHDKKRIQTNV